MAVHREYGGTGFFSSLFSGTSEDQLEYSAINFGLVSAKMSAISPWRYQKKIYVDINHDNCEIPYPI